MMGIRLWLDDVRKPPEEGMVWIKNAREAIELISDGVVKFISFDHDLGGNENYTGYTVALYIEARAFRAEICRIKWEIHSANPVGRRAIEMAMKQADKFWDIVPTR